MTKRQAGILLPISSTSGSYGIGDFGSDLMKTIELIGNSGCKYIQVLPLNPVGYGDSPYQSECSYAIDLVYLDIEQLYMDKMISKLPPKIKASSKSDYNSSRIMKRQLLTEAFANFEVNADYSAFVNEHCWVYDYGVFATLKEKFGELQWYQWPEEFKNPRFKQELIDVNKVEFHIFTQFILFQQWKRVKAYINQLGMQVIGDIPIYVATDSVDVWANQKSFLLDELGEPTYVAGVPPDYFAEDGQLWGNPLYDWDYLQSTKFEFWIKRLHHNKSMYDVIRIDHFRAFDTYWKIPRGEITARNGEWIEAPGHSFFNEVFKHFSQDDIVVEDLGDMRPEVYQLRDDFGLMGMKIIQFALDPTEDNNNFDDYPNLIVYTGTHDNQTLQGWYNDLDSSAKQLLIDRYGDDPVKGIIADTLNSVANLAILPIQDILGLDDSARFNLPGTVSEKNWTWKMENCELLAEKINWFKQLIADSKR